MNLNEALENKYFKENFEMEIQPAEQNIIVIPEEVLQEVSEMNCVLEAATAVMDAYQSANKWLDIIKEAIYHDMGCVFFSSFVHELAHTMPTRFDKFGDILHTVNMKIPYPETAYIPEEPTSIDGAFIGIFMCLDNIKNTLNQFINCTDEQYHGMACSAEELLNDIESEYPMLFKFQQEWVNCQGDLATFDKYIGQINEHRGDLLA